MGAMIWFTFWSILTVLVIVACIYAYVRRRAALARRALQVDDEAVRTILETGSLTVEEDEPLDLREIGEQEERFWSETTWDEPEEV